MKRILSVLLALCMLISVLSVYAVASSESENPFKDVTKDDWFYADVVNAVSTGIINGKTANEFKPDDYLTYAEALKLAACMNQIYLNGEVTLVSGNPWYKPYADYCLENKIIDKEYNYDLSATRAGYMEIFANALPDDAYEEINTVPDGSIKEFNMCKENDTEIAVTPSETVVVDITQTPVIEYPGGANVDDYIKDDTKSPVKIKVQPVDTEAIGYAAPVKLFVEAEDGSGIYTYQWKYILGDKGGTETFEILDNEDAMGFNTNELSIWSNPNSKLMGVNIYCTVTDANGTSVNSNTASVYGPFSMNIDSFSSGEVFSEKILSGRLNDGLLKTGDKLSVERNGKIIAFGIVKDLQMFGKSLDRAVKNDYVGIVFEVVEGVTPMDGDLMFRYQDYHEIDTSDIIN